MTFYTFELMGGEICIEPDVTYRVWLDDTQVCLEVEGLYLGRNDMLKSDDPLVKSIGERIKKTIEQDEDWIADRAEEQGYRHQTRGGTDPEARWRAA